ncbi:MAG: DUF2232 domain-containing protein, partial [Gammaproteobacteria bacterium]|nr:DUF2232 domain-containing protein [Gammaproteobacteria bacterium]
MKLLGQYLLAEKYKSVAMLSLITVMSLLIPPLTYVISAIPFALITLRKGGRYSLEVMIFTLLIISIFGYFSRIGLGLGATLTTSIWLPVWLSSMVLRITESQVMSVLIAGGIGVLFILLLSPFNQELSEWWQSSIYALLENSLSATELTQMQAVLETILPLISGIMAAGVVISLVTSLLLARAWQSALFNPGGFWQEFFSFYLPRWFTYLTLLTMAVSFAGIQGISWLAQNILIVLIVLHVVQGIVTVHRTIQRRKLSRSWLIIMYSFLIFMPQMALLIA